MCDTILAAPETAADHVMLFGKNSDRYRNEAQTVECLPRAEYSPGTQLRCTYIAIPQALRTNAVLVCRPFWIWGAEMGANEHGVVIGNEGLLSRVAAPTEEALTGMDLLRLALERADTAEEAADVIVRLLERYGQGGNCGHLKNSYYHNGFMIADADTAFVLETVGREWLCERIGGVRSISNVYSIEHPDRVSSGLAQLVRDGGRSSDVVPSYAEAIADPRSQHVGDAGTRWKRSTALLRGRSGMLDAADLMRILRDHGFDERTPRTWHPQHEHRRTLCLHAGAENVATQTTGSLVSEIRGAASVHWVTGTAAPCISIFKPVFTDVPLPMRGPSPTDRFDPRALWWRHEQMHRSALLGDYGGFLEEVASERDAMERGFRARIRAVTAGGDVAERGRVVAECWGDAMNAEERWLGRLEQVPRTDGSPYITCWDKMNLLADLDLAAR